MGTIKIIFESVDGLSSCKCEVAGASKADVALAYAQLEIIRQHLLVSMKNYIEFKKEGDLE